jgi:hypothetical protein
VDEGILGVGGGFPFPPVGVCWGEFGLSLLLGLLFWGLLLLWKDGIGFAMVVVVDEGRELFRMPRYVQSRLAGM